MPNYKISGHAYESCDIRLMKGNTFLGYKESVPAGDYSLVFSLDSIEDVDVIGVRSDGKIVGSGNITPVSTTDTADVTYPEASSIIEGIYTYTYGLVKSVYTGSVSLGHTFDRTRSVIVFTGVVSGGTVANIPYIVWSSDSTLEMARPSSSTYASPTSRINIIEYAKGVVKSIQTGYSTTSSATVTINAVNLAKSYVSSTGGSGSSNNGSPSSWSFDSATSISTTGTWSSYQVVEFN